MSKQICNHMNLSLFLGKNEFLKSVRAKVIIITKYALPNEAMTINRPQRTGLAFAFSAYVTYIGFQSIY